MINSFSGEYHFLSNFQACGGSSVEHKYQAAKTHDYKEVVQILNASTPGKAKRLGKAKSEGGIITTLRSDWEEIKLDLMYFLVKDKFTDPVLAEKLLATGDEELVEGNYWKDTFWGVYKGVGENHLGKILMRVREELRNDNDKI